ncbi:MAG: heme-binding protein [bacterium]|nr:heme-binding protein [bacterium]
MAKTTGKYTSEALAGQAKEVELIGFSLADAVALGLLATTAAQANGLEIVIEVHHLGRLAYRVALPGSRPDSDDWIARKARVVERFSASTLAMRVKYEERGTTFAEATGLSESEYAPHGGGFPIIVSGVGAVGAMYASGLPQVKDHEFIVACLRELKARA